MLPMVIKTPLYQLIVLFILRSNAKPSTYGYPAPLEEKKKEDKEKVATAVLSITNKQKKKEAEKKKDKVDIFDCFKQSLKLLLHPPIHPPDLKNGPKPILLL